MATPYFKQVTKAPADVLDFTYDWNGSATAGGPWMATGDTISTSTWSAPAGITIASDTETTTTSTVWLSGGTAGSSYDVVNTITTAGGRTKTLTLRVKVETH